jgi:hypothetical protein
MIERATRPCSARRSAIGQRCPGIMLETLGMDPAKDRARRYGLLAISLLCASCSQHSTESRRITEISLAICHSTGVAVFEAEDPRTHSQTVTITFRPAIVDVVVDFETMTGSVLHVLRREDQRDCEGADAERVCVVQLPILEGQQPGEWRAVVTKSHGTAATVELEISWESVDEEDLSTSPRDR